MLASFCAGRSYGDVGGEGGIRTLGTGVSPYNGLAISQFHAPVFGINNLRSENCTESWAKWPYLGLSVQLLCNWRPTTVSHMPTFPHINRSLSPSKIWELRLLHTGTFPHIDVL